VTSLKDVVLVQKCVMGWSEAINMLLFESDVFSAFAHIKFMTNQPIFNVQTVNAKVLLDAFMS
jgi:hypothetical protein